MKKKLQVTFQEHNLIRKLICKHDNIFLNNFIALNPKQNNTKTKSSEGSK